MNPLRTRKKILAVGIGVLVAGIVIACAYFGHKEPSYQGKSLSEWLVEDEGASMLDNDDRINQVKATGADAIRHMGTNSLPFLLARIEEEPTLVEKVLFRLNHNFVPSRVLRAYQAQTGFGILGTNAEPAIPALTNIIVTTSRVDAAIEASLALGLIGKAGTMALINMATNSSISNRSYVVATLRFATNSDVDVLPILQKCLGDSDRRTRLTATNVLRSIKPELLGRVK